MGSKKITCTSSEAQQLSFNLSHCLTVINRNPRDSLFFIFSFSVTWITITGGMKRGTGLKTGQLYLGRTNVSFFFLAPGYEQPSFSTFSSTFLSVEELKVRKADDCSGMMTSDIFLSISSGG